MGIVRAICRLTLRRVFNGLMNFSQNKKKFIKATWTLDLTYLVSSFGDRLWAFAVGIFMHKIGGMTWVAIQQLTDSIAKLVLLPHVGSSMDRNSRIAGMQTVLAVNNIAIGISATAFFGGLSISPSETHLSTICLILALVFGSISRVASEAQKTAFTKDWMMVLIENETDARLSSQISIMNVIDQLSSCFSPLLAGYITGELSQQTCCLIIIVWNLISWVGEATVLQHIYNTNSALSKRNRDSDVASEEKAPEIRGFFDSYRAYFRQTSFRAAFGLAMLYLTVLGFDNLAVSHGLSQGVSPYAIGVFRSAGSFFGVLGSTCFTVIERHVGLLWTGVIGLGIQNFFINLCSISTVMPGNPFNATGYIQDLTPKKWADNVWVSIVRGSPTHNVTAESVVPFHDLPSSIIMFFVGITIARFGLWIADPAITQIMQETIPERERYTVFAVQTSICEFFSIVKDIGVIGFPETEMFSLLTVLSCVFVFSGFLFFMAYCYKCSLHSHRATEVVAPEDVEMKGMPETSEQEILLNRQSSD